MPEDQTDFDVILVGGANATALTKFIQHEQDDVNNFWKMALVTDRGRYIIPQAYFGVMHHHIAPLELETGTVSSQVDNSSRTDIGARIVKYLPHENKVQLSNGKEYTYKALVVASGFNHTKDKIEGLTEMEKTPESENFFLHMLDGKERADRNYQHGWNHNSGNMICYSPKAPYKGEGSDFYALYYESFLRQDQLQGRSGANARIQYYTPNKEIFKFPYANEIALDECFKRGIDVNFGMEMTKVAYNEIGEKIATFVNVDTGATTEVPFNHANINPTSLPQSELVEAGITDSSGLVDVNPYTLQHSRFENIFAFGDCIAGETTRTQHAAIAQCPVVKHNLNCFMEGKELNGIYDGYSYMPFYVSHSNMIPFSHLWDYEPCSTNHWVPTYGLFSRLYFTRMMSVNFKEGKKYSDFKKNFGPPNWRYAARYDPIESNEYLQSKSVDIEALKSIHKKDNALPGNGGVVPT